MQADEPFSSGRVLLVVAHSDDEVIGAGAQLPRLCDRIDVVHVTNGAPDNNPDYVAARLRESLNALELAGIPEECCHEFGITDQKSSFQLKELTLKLEAFSRRVQPDIIITHPYEGGHPDHDACAFAVHIAVERCRHDSRAAEIWEFTSYHMGPGGSIEAGVFLRRDRVPELAVHLTQDQRTLKRKMFDCFESQLHVLADFSVEVERFRPAPHYDFTQPPHSGQLYYEQFEWGVKGREWRDLAARAVHDLGSKLHATHSS